MVAIIQEYKYLKIINRISCKFTTKNKIIKIKEKINLKNKGIANPYFAKKSTESQQENFLPLIALSHHLQNSNF